MADQGRDPKYGSGGVLFTNADRKSDKAPVMNGDITITREDLREMFATAQAGKEVKLFLTCWERQGRQVKFLSVKVETEVSHDKREAEFKSQSGGRSQQGGGDPWDQSSGQGGLDDEIPF